MPRIKHGKRNTRVYAVWGDMKNRCLNPRAQAYRDYGGRGITVCERWMSFANFLADMGEPPAGMELDRKNNDGPYSPDNCQWASIAEQARNRRSSRILTFNGESKCASEWARQLGISTGTMYGRLELGWTMQEIVTIPPLERHECRGRFSPRNLNTSIQLTPIYRKPSKE